MQVGIPIIAIVVSLILFSSLSYTQGLILGHPLEFWDSADIVLDGVVISTSLNETDNLVRHDVKVEQYFKNPKTSQMITVYGPSIYNEEWFYPKFFEEGERALFYLKLVDAKYIILPHSIAATEKCSPRDMLGLSTLPGEPMGRGGPTLFFDPYQICNGYFYSVDYLSSALKPLKQVEAGIKLEDVKCQEERIMTVKIDGTPACVKDSSIVSLIVRGWAQLSDFTITKGFFKHTITNGKITSMEYHGPQDCAYVVVKLESQDNGDLAISIPRKIIDVKFGEEDDNFFVLIDGQEVDYEEIHKDANQRTLSIPFKEGSETIEIIKTCLI